MKYTTETTIQILIALLKKHNIKKVIASPGSANSSFVASMQSDSYFEMYSCVDERSAAYLACGMSEESGEPVVITCTGATASSNYYPGLTEAYYRNIKILAVTATQKYSNIGHLVPQVVDRSLLPVDSCQLSLHLPLVVDDDSKWDCEVKVNTALLELFNKGGGPVHINLPTTYSKDFSVEYLPPVRVISRYSSSKNLHELADNKVALHIGSHQVISNKLESIIDDFCDKFDSVVFCDHTSGYFGKYAIHFSIAAEQIYSKADQFRPDISLQIGNISGDYPSYNLIGKTVWRISPDGKVKDTHKRLSKVFQMEETDFFSQCMDNSRITETSEVSYFDLCNNYLEFLRNNIPELPFSNIWISQILSRSLPKDSVVQFSILNTLRSWNLFNLPKGVRSQSNVGGFGIDGGLSTLIGSSLVQKKGLSFCFIGDLAFFYDMNALGIRNLPKTLRILLINNGKGIEFRNYRHHTSHMGDSADAFIAAAGHYGNKSKYLVKNYSENLGFIYLSAENKSDFISKVDFFIDPNSVDQSIVFECFVNDFDEVKSLELVSNIETDASPKNRDLLHRVMNSSKLKNFRNKFIS